MAIRNRGTKWYRKNEAELMKSFGLKPTKNSGATWLEKGDGYNDELLVELKSTDANSYRISRVDMDKLEYHALIEHKVLVFMVQFLQDDKVYLLLEPQYLPDVYNSICGDENALEGKRESQVIVPDTKPAKEEKVIKSSKSSKDKMRKLLEKEREERNKNFKNNIKKSWK